MFILETPMGDKWEYDSEKDARRDKYIFGGTIKQVDNEEQFDKMEKGGK